MTTLAEVTQNRSARRLFGREAISLGRGTLVTRNLAVTRRFSKTCWGWIASRPRLAGCSRVMVAIVAPRAIGSRGQRGVTIEHRSV